ncbi:MAG: thioredoxin fold domain-containing protein [Gammaproteobacteria bacterium]|nr:thioredoxin fold domain-containing protein [Gammaproteobacteria bacterium]
MNKLTLIRTLFNFHVALLVTLLFFSVQVNAKTEGELSAGLENPGHEEHPAWFKVSFLDLFEDVKDAADNNKRVMVYFYQDGCPYCKKLLRENFSQRDISEKAKKYLDVVSINLWGDKEVTVGDRTYTEKEFAEALKVQYTPTLLFFNEDNKIIFRANGYYPPEKFSALLDYIGSRQESILSYQDYMEKVSPQPATGRLHDDINSVVSVTNLSGSDKPLLVMFEQKKCSTCDELHLDILKRKESVELLSHFNVVVLDMWSDQLIATPAGEVLKLRDWAKKLDIKYAPSLVFFDKQGIEVFRTDAYLKAFHTQSVMDYVSSGAYKTESNFQRYIDKRADHLREMGIKVDLMK